MSPSHKRNLIFNLIIEKVLFSVPIAESMLGRAQNTGEAFCHGGRKFTSWSASEGIKNWGLKLGLSAVYTIFLRGGIAVCEGAGQGRRSDGRAGGCDLRPGLLEGVLGARGGGGAGGVQGDGWRGALQIERHVGQRKDLWGKGLEAS